ncbi:MAG: Ig domain-containing protein, partial [Akkermansiaceae bacterium]|nr:Ig domain-containing protein [Akkermansiaceae bacterium]
GPDWLTIAPDGALSGKPENSDVGPNLFTVRVTDAEGLFAEAELRIEVTEGIVINPDANGNGILDVWEIARFGNADPGSNPADGDPEGDGICNLLEYALDTNPLAANPSPVRYDLALVDGKLHPRLVVPKNVAATNLVYLVEVSGNLGTDSWSVAGTTIEVESATELIVRDDRSIDDGPQRFLRLRVEVIPTP